MDELCEYIIDPESISANTYEMIQALYILIGKRRQDWLPHIVLMGVNWTWFN